ncbi:MAG: hypothetical protein Q7K21_01110 [Elusimicrobiota bacterium]|nr:hypothetical protein [Elusimicrobiota bacterium]
MKKFKLNEFTIFCIVNLAMIKFSFAQQTSTNTATQEKEFVNPLLNGTSSPENTKKDIQQYLKDLQSDNHGQRISAVWCLADMDIVDKKVIKVLVEELNYGSDLEPDGECGTQMALASSSRKECAKRLLSLLDGHHRIKVLKILKSIMKQNEKYIKEILKDIVKKGGCYEAKN